ncbi:MAG: hypothetical protein H3C62_00430 [Gemmatimonadaceae bacterium]|nr:hypothetical protein [Gemmatimonadaceae bacterium]
MLLLIGFVLACDADRRGQPERPAVAKQEHATLVRIAATTRLADTQLVSFGATLDLRSHRVASPPDLALIRAVVAALRTEVARTYKTGVDLAASTEKGVKTPLVERTALSVLDPRYRLAWVHIEWVVAGGAFRATRDLCLDPAQTLSPDDSLTGAAICQPYVRGFLRASEAAR